MVNQCTSPAIDKLYEKALTQNIPVSVLFELTHRCNLRCCQCYVSPEKEKELSLEEIKRVLDQLAASGALYLTLSGGEIFLRKDFFEIMTYARSINFAIRLFTNGTLVTESLADRIAALSPLDVCISIYGPDADSHEFVTRIPGSFNASLRTLKLLNARGVKTIVKCLLMRHNVANIADVVALAERLGANAQFDPLVTPRSNGDLAPAYHRIDSKALANLISEDMPRDKADLRKPLFCGAGRDMVSISPSGRVYPCVQFPVCFGSLREEIFADIWLKSDKAIALRSLKPSNIEMCALCADREYCRPCPGLNVIETGDWHSPSQLNCWVAHTRKQAIEESSEGGLYEKISL